jgi:hypothetical protein
MTITKNALSLLCTRRGKLSDLFRRKEYTIATNGRAMIMVKGLDCDKTMGPEFVDVSLFSEAKTPHKTSLRKLKVWSGKAERCDYGECIWCKGSGISYLDKNDYCSFCSGSGEYDYAKSRPGVVFGLVIDRNLLARYLWRIDDKRDVNVGIGSNGFGKSVLIVKGDDWIVVVMKNAKDP